MGAITIPAGSNSPDAERLHNATTISDDTFAVSNVIILSFVFISLAFALFSLPWTFFRLQHAGWFTGFRLSSKQPAPMPTKHRVLPGRLYPDTDVNLPRRIGRLPLALPTYVIPFINLSVPQAFLLVITTLVVLLASFVGSNVLTDSTRTGYVAVTVVPCVIMLGNKVFGLGTILQVGYASINWFHRWLGRLLFFVVTVHVAAYFTIFAQTHSMRAEMSKSSNALAGLSYAGFCLVFCASIGTIRQKCWRLFKVCHHFGIFLFLLGLNYHSKILRPWVLYSVFAILISSVSRALTSKLHIAYLTPLTSSKSTIIHLPSLRSGWIPGQHARIRVLTGGMGLMQLWESHPFTLSTAPGGHGAKLIVKAAGDWTNRLFEVAQKTGKVDVELGVGPGKCQCYPVAVLIEGPYGGCNFVYSAYSSVLLVAGGSGVSYVLGVAEGMIMDVKLGKSRTRELNIVWSVRDRAAVNDVLPLFERILESAKLIPNFTLCITLHFTSVSRGLIIRPFSLLPASSATLPRRPKILTKSPLSGMASTPNSAANLLGLGNSSRIEVEDKKQFVLEEKLDGDGKYLADEKIDPFAELPPMMDTSPPIELKPGRPDYEAILKEMIYQERTFSESLARKLNLDTGAASTTVKGGIAVGACGPPELILSLRKLCWNAEELGAREPIEFHDEAFSL